MHGNDRISEKKIRGKIATSVALRENWGLEVLQVRTMWEQGLTGEGVKVGLLDRGLDSNHPALEGSLEAYKEFFDPGGANLGLQTKSRCEHGTHIAAIICGGKVRSSHFGVAPRAQLFTAVITEGGNLLERSAEAIVGGFALHLPHIRRQSVR